MDCLCNNQGLMKSDSNKEVQIIMRFNSAPSDVFAADQPPHSPQPLFVSKGYY